jgi:peptidoglycan/xylan/chitin deacetylase (PgdA/CDA1 family)
MKKKAFILSFDVEAGYGRNHLRDYPRLLPLIAQEQKMIKKILKLLKKYKITATWAVVGRLFIENPELIKLIKQDKQEIASHSFSHPDFSRISAKVARQEFSNSVKTANKLKIKLKYFVFPFNRVNHAGLLNDYGFTDYRRPGLINPMYFASKRKWGRLIPYRGRLIAAKSGFIWAKLTGKQFHLWTHPIDLIDARGHQLSEFEQILRFLSRN